MFYKPRVIAGFVFLFYGKCFACRASSCTVFVFVVIVLIYLREPALLAKGFVSVLGYLVLDASSFLVGQLENSIYDERNQSLNRALC